MNSFYGGKQGRTYHIVARYSSVQQMVEQFQRGGDYTVVNYGQYVIIDTIGELGGRSNPQNGLLFRRGFNYNQAFNNKEPDLSDSKYIIGKTSYNYQAFQKDWYEWVQNVGGGAEYIGQIVGPKGQPGTIEPISWREYNEYLNDPDYPQEGYQIISPKVVTSIQGSLGKDINEQGQTIYNDTIQVATFMVRDKYGNITESFIAFDIPITIFDFSVVQGNAYESPKIDRLNPASTYRDENNNIISEYHNFSYDYQLTIPGGKKGDSLLWFKVQSNKNGDISDLLDDNTDNQYLTYKIRSYNNFEDGDDLHPSINNKSTGWFPYRIIKTISENKRTRNYINKTTIPTIGDIYEITENELYAVCIKIENSENYGFPTEITSSSIPGTVISNNSSSWYIMDLSPASSKLTVNYTYENQNNPASNFSTRFIDYLYSDAYGNIYVVYSTDEANQNQGHKIGSFNSIKSVQQDSNDFNKIIVSYIQGNAQEFYVPRFDDLMVSQTFKYKDDAFNISENPVNLSSSFNYPVDMKRYGDTIAVLYLDPVFRQSLATSGSKNVDYYIFPYKDAAHKKYYGNQEDFENDIKDAEERSTYTRVSGDTKNGLIYKILTTTTGGFHIYGQVNLLDLIIERVNGQPIDPSINYGALANGIQDYLQGQYKERAGWVVTSTLTTIVEGQEETTKTIYAFDYQMKSKQTSYHTITIDGVEYKTYWYIIQDVNMDLLDPSHMYIIGTPDPNTGKPINTEQLDTNGLWFVVSNGHLH